MLLDARAALFHAYAHSHWEEIQPTANVYTDFIKSAVSLNTSEYISSACFGVHAVTIAEMQCCVSELSAKH